MVTFPGSAYPKEISQQCTPTTHTEAVHYQRVLLGVFHPCLWPLKAPGSTLGEGSPKPLVSSLTPVPPFVRSRPHNLRSCPATHTKTSCPSLSTTEVHTMYECTQQLNPHLYARCDYARTTGYPLNDNFPVQPVSSYQTVSILYFIGARMKEVVTTGAVRRAKLYSNSYHQQTNTRLFTD